MREGALYCNTATNERFVAVGTRTGVEVPQCSRLIAHTQPGTGAGAVSASGADEAALSRLGQRSSVIIDQGGTAERGLETSDFAILSLAEPTTAITEVRKTHVRQLCWRSRRRQRKGR